MNDDIFYLCSLLSILTVMILPLLFLSSISTGVIAADHLQPFSAQHALSKPLTGFIWGSQPDDIEEYNYCNMPHVNHLTYQNVSKDYELVYVELIHRHHKRTPYASNLVPTDIIESYYQYPEITTGGKIDSLQHGVDLFNVYHNILGFLPDEYDPELIGFRVTNNNITTEVFNVLKTGYYPFANITAELRTVDNLEPNLKCHQADGLKNAIRSTDIWYQETNATLYKELGSIFGLNATGSPSFFNSIDHFFDNLSSKTCAGDRVNVTTDQFEQVVKLGHWEYDYTYRQHPNATEYGKYRYGNFTLELIDHFDTFISGERKIKYQHNIAHDGSIAALTALIHDYLNLNDFKWPGMGSEYVFELYKNRGDFYLRILYSGAELSFDKLDLFKQYITEIGTADASSTCS